PCLQASLPPTPIFGGTAPDGSPSTPAMLARGIRPDSARAHGLVAPIRDSPDPVSSVWKLAGKRLRQGPRNGCVSGVPTRPRRSAPLQARSPAEGPSGATNEITQLEQAMAIHHYGGAAVCGDTACNQQPQTGEIGQAERKRHSHRGNDPEHESAGSERFPYSREEACSTNADCVRGPIQVLDHDQG